VNKGWSGAIAACDAPALAQGSAGRDSRSFPPLLSLEAAWLLDFAHRWPGCGGSGRSRIARAGAIEKI
jgi:hypothetical protein